MAVKYTTQNRYLRPHQASLSDWRCFEHACRCSKASKGRLPSREQRQQGAHPRSTYTQVPLGRCLLQLRSLCQSSAVLGCDNAANNMSAAPSLVVM